MSDIDKTSFDGLRFNSDNMSCALNMIIMAIIKRTKSRAILVKLSSPIPKPYMSRDSGYNNCISPVRKSPMMLCCITATK